MKKAVADAPPALLELNAKAKEMAPENMTAEQCRVLAKRLGELKAEAERLAYDKEMSEAVAAAAAAAKDEEAAAVTVAPVHLDYRSPESIHAQLLPRGELEHPPVRLLRSEWLIERADKFRAAKTDEERGALILPRRQDLERDEPGAFYSANQMRLLECSPSKQMPVVVVSHAWETRVHPDPNGTNLLLLANALKRAHTTAEGVVDRTSRTARLLPPCVGIFIDYCSVFQRDPKLFDASETPEAKAEGDERYSFKLSLDAKTAFYGGAAYEMSRKGAELAAYNAAVANMDVWYAHALTTVVLLTKTPEGSVDYFDKGWPTLERSVSMLIKQSVGEADWPTIIDMGLHSSLCKRFAPLTPEGMQAVLKEKTFSNAADLEVVLRLYKLAAERCIYTAEVLDYFGLGYGDEDMKVLCEWWPKCGEAKELNLNGNKFTEAGWDMLAELIGPQEEGGHKLLPKLKRIFHGGEAEDKPTEKLKEVCAERKIAVREVKLGPVF